MSGKVVRAAKSARQSVTGRVRSSRRARRRERLLASVSSEDRALIDRIRSERLTFLSVEKMCSIAATCREIEARGIAGSMVEAGCALGGSAALIGSIKRDERPLEVYDVFGMIPPPTEDDPPEVHDRYRVIAEGKATGFGDDEYYGYVPDLRHVVQSNLERFGIDESKQVSLVEGLVQDTLVGDGPVAFAHIDVDWYEPVLTCLERIGPRLSPGGSIVIDDYNSWAGCRKATHAYLDATDLPFSLDDTAGSMKLTLA